MSSIRLNRPLRVIRTPAHLLASGVVIKVIVPFGVDFHLPLEVGVQISGRHVQSYAYQSLVRFAGLFVIVVTSVPGMVAEIIAGEVDDFDIHKNVLATLWVAELVGGDQELAYIVAVGAYYYDWRMERVQAGVNTCTTNISDRENKSI